jgi:acyl transferase domain-containing protein/threonine dehydrogenase-like Zn-dependent dehydrogenase/NAD(P)-dependent dehydrogenase (short-subunit alcohol dehydrogenase family)/acyl carrier protein
VPPNLHFRTPNPRIDLAGLGLRVPAEIQPLPDAEPIYAAVNSFGYGGTNAHAILGSVPPPSERAAVDFETADRLYPVSARDKAALAAFAGSIADSIPHIPLQDLGHTLTMRRSHHSVRAAVWAQSSEALIAGLRNLDLACAEGRACVGSAPEQPLRLLFAFTGMGAQYVGMGRTLFAEQQVFREAIVRCAALVPTSSGKSLIDIFSGAADARRIGTPISAPIDAQLPNLAMQVGLTELWRSLGIEPQGVIGHSVGEIGAAWAAGALTLEEALRVTFHRGEAFQRLAGHGSMMAVGLGRPAAAKYLNGRDDDLSVTAMLGPDSVVVGGPPAALDRLATELAASGVFHRRLHVDVAYHHAQIDAIEHDLRDRFGEVAHAAPRLPLYSTLLGARVEAACHDADYWCRGGRAPANFEAGITAALADGFDAVLEIGPHRVLGAAVKSCAAALGRVVWTGASVIRDDPEFRQIQRTLADMYVQGVPIRWGVHHSGGRFVRLPNYPWQRTRLWSESPETRASRDLDSIEPLLHQRLDNPAPAWQTDLSSTLFPYLGDHVVSGTPLFPGAGYATALLAASRVLGRGNSLDGLRVERALPIMPTTRLRVDVDESTGMGVVRARADAESAWQRHATGRLGLTRPPRQIPLDLDACPPTHPHHMAADSFYAALAERGLAYGPQFQAVRGVWFGQDELLASLALPEGVAPAGPLHPVLLDGAFQALAVFASPTDRRGPMVPVSIEEVRLHGGIHAAAWAVGRVIERSANSFAASLYLCDTSGKVAAEITGLRCQRVPTADRDRLAQATFHDTWERSAVPHVRRGAAQRWLIVDGYPPLADPLAVELRSYGHTEMSVARHELMHQAGNAPVHGVVWMAPAADRGDAGLTATERLLGVIQELVCWPEPRPRLVIVTHGAMGGAPRAEQASLWGLGRVAASEYPDLQVTIVDCDNDDRVPLWLCRELLGDGPDREVRLGPEGRQVARVRMWSPKPPELDQVSVEAVPVILRQTRPGSQDSLTWHEFSRRAPAPGELEIRSDAAALNFKDVLKSMNLLSGAYLERTFFGDNLGMETSGVVTRVGQGVTDFAPGDEVVLMSPHFASYLVVDAGFVMCRPPHLSATDAPVFINYMTAVYGLIEIARLQPNERVLIHLASGGVGQAAIAIARMIGAQIFATAGDEDKRAHLRAQGIEHVFDSRNLDFADGIMRATTGAGVDVVLNSLSGEALRRGWDVLAPYGRFVEIGKRDIEDDSALHMRRFDENRTFAAIDLDRLLRERPAVFRRIFSDVRRLFVDGRIGPLPVTAFPASQVAEAFRTMSRARHIGKVVVDFRGQQVRAQRLPPARFRDDRTYLVTGAFGGFGRALVSWMVREGARHLVLVGRSGAASKEAQKLMVDLAADGINAAACAIDVADADMVRQVTDNIRRRGPPLGGVFHAAMRLDDGLLSSFDAGRLAAVMRPKAIGAWNLHCCTTDDLIDHFVLFSSVAQVIGNIGQGAYCAANAFLDGLARQRQAAGLPALSIAWGVLSDAGVAARTDGLVAKLEELGLRAFTTAQALTALGRLMDQAPATIACADVDWPGWARHAALAATPRFSQVVQSRTGDDRFTAFRRDLVSHPAAERHQALEATLCGALAAVLGTPADRIPTDRSLDNLGVDSLMAVELTVSLERDTGVTLPTSLLMQGPTISMLAAHVLQQVLAVDRLDESAVDGLSEAETDAMLEMLAASGELELSRLP